MINILQNWSFAVPTVFPINIYCQLSMVDSLEKIGIFRHFSSEIMSILDRIYR
jgi:ent-kaurene synthase